MNNAHLISKSIVINVGIFNNNAAMNSTFEGNNFGMNNVLLNNPSMNMIVHSVKNIRAMVQLHGTTSTV